jgi:hypothetical protein
MQTKKWQTSKDILHKTDGVVDIDWTVANQTEYKLVVEKKKAMLNRIAPQQIVGNLTYVLNILFLICMMKIEMTM